MVGDATLNHRPHIQRSDNERLQDLKIQVLLLCCVGMLDLDKDDEEQDESDDRAQRVVTKATLSEILGRRATTNLRSEISMISGHSRIGKSKSEGASTCEESLDEEGCLEHRWFQ